MGTGELIDYIGISAQRAFIGFLIGGIIGFLLGLLNGLSSIAETLFDTSLQMLRNIPHLALIPLVILWFGIRRRSENLPCRFRGSISYLFKYISWCEIGG